jgi:hypothetical protein
MRLDWNDIKARAAKFAEDWNGAQYERGETQTFYNEFFELFGVTRRRVASFEHPVKLLKKRGYLDLFWKGKLKTIDQTYQTERLLDKLRDQLAPPR